MKIIITLLLAFAIGMPASALNAIDRTQNKELKRLKAKSASKNYVNKQIKKYARQLNQLKATQVKQFVAVDTNGDVVGPAFLRVSDVPANPTPLIWVYLEELQILLDIRPPSAVHFTGPDCTGSIYQPAVRASSGSTLPAAFIFDGEIWAPTGEIEENVQFASYFGTSHVARWNGCVNGQWVYGSFYLEPIAPWTYRFPIAVEMK